MKPYKSQNLAILAPSKSAALALLFSLLLGPVGMIYATITGALVMGFLEAVVFKGTQNLLIHPGALIMLWILGCLWSVISVNCYNKRILKWVSGDQKRSFKWKKYFRRHTEEE